jgi:enoyl-CoA hydratase/carnithine racemase
MAQCRTDRQGALVGITWTDDRRPFAGDVARRENRTVSEQRQHVLVEREGDITTITLNRPEKRNALSLEVMLELTDVLREVGRSDALGVVLAANGPVFSAGHNFADMAGADLATAEHLFEVCTEMMDTLQAIPQPVCAKVHALATAAGCQLVATCDLAVASLDAAFAIPGGKGGLFCHTPLVAVARNVGRKRALELALTGDPVDARTAAEWGLVNRAVPADELDAATLDLISRATRGSVRSKALGKQAFYAQVDLPQAAAYEHAIAVMAAAAVSPDAQEGIAAFLEKRRAVFTERP